MAMRLPHWTLFPLVVSLLLSLALCVWLAAERYRSQAAAPESTPYRETLVAPYTGPARDPISDMAARVHKPLTKDDILWLIPQLTNGGLEAAAVLSQSRSPAAAAALLLKVHADYSHNVSGIIYRAIGDIDHPAVLDLLATDYRNYGYRTDWALAVAARMGRKIDLWGGDPHIHVDRVYEWWQAEGRAAFFSRYPDLERLRYPDGPDIVVERNVPTADK